MNQDTQIVKRLSIAELRPQMIIARDILGKSGEVLFRKGTVIDRDVFEGLRNSDIIVLYILEKSINMEKPEFLHPPKRVEVLPVVSRPEFKSFEKDYITTNEDIKRTLISISSGASINISRLYKMTDGILSKMKFIGDVFTYLSFLKNRDEYTFSHSNNVALLTNIFGMWIGLDKEQLVTLTTAAMLHDIGKTKIPDSLLNKKGKLTTAEFDEIKKHTTYGYRMLENHENIPNDVKLVALMHHEKIDGSGYPMNLPGDKIIPFAKIVAICDIYDAMTADRAYRGKICPFKVIKNFEQHSYGNLDTEYLLIFLRNIANNYVGCKARLSDERIGDIVFINRLNLSKPIVRCDTEIVDLSTTPGLEIVNII